MRRLKLIITLIAAVLPLCANAAEDFDMKSYLFGHIGDSYEWHIAEVGETEITIPLPCIVIDGGLRVFFSSRMEEHGYTLNEDGKLVNALTMERPALDISITKNVAGLMINAILLVVLILSCTRWYRTHDVLKDKPRGLVALIEPVIEFVDKNIISGVIGPNNGRYAPYLLTVFFFILINNLMGLVPFFPGGANITGNIAVTFVLAVFTFLMVNLFASKEYFKEIVWPDVPVFLKALPLMPLIELLSVFTKPFSLMVRLFANILGGHIMILSIIGLIFISASMGAIANGAFTFISLLLGVFLECLELLVAFVQAYVFTMLSAVFISLAHPGSEAVEVKAGGTDRQ